MFATIKEVLAIIAPLLQVSKNGYLQFKTAAEIEGMNIFPPKFDVYKCLSKYHPRIKVLISIGCISFGGHVNIYPEHFTDAVVLATAITKKIIAKQISAIPPSLLP